MAEMNRRVFLAATAGACAMCVCAGRFAPAAEEGGTVEVGRVADYGKDGVVDTWAKERGFFVIRQGGRLYAASARCTHVAFGKLVAKGDAGKLVCPMHGSSFALDGTVTRGPAQVALARFGIEVNGEGKVVVDLGKRFEQGRWEEGGSFVKV